MRLRRRVSLTHRRSLNEWALKQGFSAVSDLVRDVADLEARLVCINDILNDAFQREPYAYDFQGVNVAHGVAHGRPLPKPVHLKEATR